MSIPFALKWEDLTSEEIAIVQQHLANGCGPGLLKSIFNVPDYIFKDCCNEHDFRFWRGGPEGYKDQAFQWANISMLACFRERMKYHPNGHEYLDRADDYYVLVKLGRAFFNWGQEKTREDLHNLVQKLEKV
jgi:hypothetical protein